jgi:hypothetical protein
MRFAFMHENEGNVTVLLAGAGKLVCLCPVHLDQLKLVWRNVGPLFGSHRLADCTIS